MTALQSAIKYNGLLFEHPVPRDTAGQQAVVVEEVKENDFMGHHAVVSNADYTSQKAILKKLHHDNGSFFLTEEMV